MSTTTHTHGGTDAPECTSCTTANPDPIAELLAGVPITGLRHTGTDSYLTPASARKLAAHLREQGLALQHVGEQDQGGTTVTRFTTEEDYQALHAAYDMISANEAADTAGASMSLDLGHDLMQERLAVIEDRAYQTALRDVAEKLKGLEDLALATRVLGTVEHLLHTETTCWCGAPKNTPEEDPQQSCSANLWHDTRRDLRVPAAP